MKYEVGDTISIDTGNGKAEGVIIGVDGNDFICHLTNAKLRVHADKVFQTNRQWLESLTDEEFVRKSIIIEQKYSSAPIEYFCIIAGKLFEDTDEERLVKNAVEWLQAGYKDG